MANQLFSFQERGISSISQKLASNKSVLAVSPTGSGKTVILSTIAYRFTQKSKKKVIIFVHKTELLDQTREKLFGWYGILSQKIDANTKFVDNTVDVYVAMVETFNNRSKHNTFLDNFQNVGLVIVDEAHLSNFKKIFVHFYEAKRIGLTATPISATKKDPLKNYYQDIAIVSTVKELIALNELNPMCGVVPCNEYSLKNIDRKSLKMKGNDFDEDAMGKEFSKGKQVENTINAYLNLGYGKKTICFNANIEHSLIMNQAFLDAGLNSRHLDGNKNGKYGNEAYRRDTFEWMKNTDNAILCNVGIATTGYDEPSIESVIVNKSTTSLPLFKQMLGRGGRPYRYPSGAYKADFLLLDMGDNCEGGGLGRYDDDIDWESMFWEPKIPKPLGVSAIKTCPECGALNSVSARICQGLVEDFFDPDSLVSCGYVFNMDQFEQDEVYREMVKIGDGIDIRKNIEFFKDKKEYFVYYETIRQIASMMRKKIDDRHEIKDFELDAIYETTNRKLTEWFKMTGKRKFPGYTKEYKLVVDRELKSLGFKLPQDIEFEKQEYEKFINQ